MVLRTCFHPFKSTQCPQGKIQTTLHGGIKTLLECLHIPMSLPAIPGIRDSRHTTPRSPHLPLSFAQSLPLLGSCHSCLILHPVLVPGIYSPVPGEINYSLVLSLPSSLRSLNTLDPAKDPSRIYLPYQHESCL